MSNGSGRRIARLFKPYRTRLLGLLGLIVIPAAYSVLHDLGDGIARRFGRRRHGTAAETA